MKDAWKMPENKRRQIEVLVENDMQQKWRNATARIFMMLGDMQIVPPKYYGTMIKQNLKMIEDSVSHGSSFDDAVDSVIVNLFHTKYGLFTKGVEIIPPMDEEEMYGPPEYI